MTIIETSRCREFGQPEFRFSVELSAVIEPDISFFTRSLEAWVEDGERFRDGETLQFGWSVLLIRANADGTLSLLEPDFRQMPIQWTESVTLTLQHLRLQKDVCESFFESERVDFPSVLRSCIVCAYFQDSEYLIMKRTPPSDDDSGWFIGCNAKQHDHDDPSQLHRVSLYEAVLQNRIALPYLALPSGVLLQVDAEHVPAVFHHGTQRRPKPGSYVEARAKARPTTR